MQITTVYAEDWDDDHMAYVPTEEVLGYRALTDAGVLIGYGDTRDSALECARRAMWRTEIGEGLVPISKIIRTCMIIEHNQYRSEKRHA